MCILLCTCESSAIGIRFARQDSARCDSSSPASCTVSLLRWPILRGAQRHRARCAALNSSRTAHDASSCAGSSRPPRGRTGIRNPIHHRHPTRGALVASVAGALRAVFQHQLLDDAELLSWVSRPDASTAVAPSLPEVALDCPALNESNGGYWGVGRMTTSLIARRLAPAG